MKRNDCVKLTSCPFCGADAYAYEIPAHICTVMKLLQWHCITKMDTKHQRKLWKRGRENRVEPLPELHKEGVRK